MFVVIIFVWHGLAGTWAAGAVIVLRLMTAVGLATLVTMTTRLTDLVAVVTWALTPLRRLGLSTRAVEISIALVIRFTPVLAMKGAQLVSAWRARSPRRPSPRILMPMVILAIDDAEYVAEALRARGGV
jgi:biotin transport system permease protein